MGDLLPFRKPKPRQWTRPEDYGRVLPTARWQGPPPTRRGGPVGRSIVALRPWVLLIVLASLWYGLDFEPLKPLPLLSTEPERVSGNFTRCGPGRGTFCVIDGDTFKLGERKVRVLGVDAPELHPPRCPLEAQRGEAATAALQLLLNQGPFTMVAKLNDQQDQYGRDLRSLSRVRADGSVQLIATDLIAGGTVRRYLGGTRGGWC